ncbi:MAG: accessory gene regulator B family protein [Acutalibacteraceae bacterium]|nr:accessory gene regulator B family protein [Acutalibacteraceae bacterium]
MMDSVSEKCIEFFVDNDIIKNEDKELYQYALSITISAVIHILTIIVLGITFSLVVESIIFYMCFIAIRKFAGGYHAKTARSCYFFSVLLSVILLIILKLLICNMSSVIKIITITVSLISTVCIWIMAPSDTENNPLSNKEKIVYRRVARIISLLVFIMFIVFLILGQYNIALSVGLGIFMSVLVLIMRKIELIFSKTR